MLVKFKVANFLSYNKEQTLSMEAGKVRAHSDRIYTNKKLKLLKFMSIYGANASGKSNLIEALDFSKQIIVTGLPSDFGDYYCKLSEENADLPTKFEYTIELEGKRYCYGFSVILKNASFQSEWLYELTYGKNYNIIFERKIPNSLITVSSYFKDIALNERLEIYADDIKSDDSILFLTLMNKNKAAFYDSFEEALIYRELFGWFRRKLSVNSPDRPITNFSYLMNKDSVGRISELLSDFSTGVSQFELVDVSLDKVFGNVPKELTQEISDHLSEQRKYLSEKNNNEKAAIILRSSDNTMFIIELEQDGTTTAKTFQFSHRNTKAVFSLREESDGTIRLLDLIEILLSADKEKVYVIDEINRRFHPLLTYHFIEKYLEIAAHAHIQLIVTTHESRLMDFSLLRKDEINFINRDEKGFSEIYSFERFGERFDKKICTAYLRGDYGAIPIFKDKNGLS